MVARTLRTARGAEGEQFGVARGGPHPCIAPYRRPRQRMAFGVLCRWPPTKNSAFSEHR